jgi:hypothetical protein
MATGPTGGGIPPRLRLRRGGGVVQAASAKASGASANDGVRCGGLRHKDCMWILMVEAGVAMFLLVFIVWWTMYSGPKATRHEQEEHSTSGKDEADDAPKP